MIRKQRIIRILKIAQEEFPGIEEDWDIEKEEKKIQEQSEWDKFKEEKEKLDLDKTQRQVSRAPGWGEKPEDKEDMNMVDFHRQWLSKTYRKYIKKEKSCEIYGARPNSCRQKGRI